MLVVKKKVLLYLSRTTNATTTASTHTRRCEKKEHKVRTLMHAGQWRWGHIC